MHYPIHIRFSGLESSIELTTAAESHACGLTWVESEIINCWVGIHCDPEHALSGGPYSVRVDVSIPGYDLVTPRVQHEDVYRAIDSAFLDMKHQLSMIDPKVNHAEFAPTTTGPL